MATTNTQSFAGEVKVTSNLNVNTNTLHVDSITGRVGMGKTDPGYTMDVNGTVNATALYVGGSEFAGGAWTESGSDIYYTGGNVGIATTDPQKKLHVAGPMRLGNGVNFDLTAGDWSFQTKLAHPNPVTGNSFGWATSISGDGSYALVGSLENNFEGSAEIFVRSGSTWSHQAKITAPDGVSPDYFGQSVSISSDGSYALVGAHKDDGPAGPTDLAFGSAYIYVRDGSTWTYQAKITAPDGAYRDEFGYSVSISGDGSYALVGAFKDDAPATDSGSAHIFVRDGSTWTHQAHILDPNGAQGDYFGRSVSISSDGSYALVGAERDDEPAPWSGSAHIFVRSGSNWTHQTKLVNPDPGPSDFFGFSVSISGDGSYALMGSVGKEAGYIFVREESTWSHQATIISPSPASNFEFGDRVSISGDGSYALVGARNETGPAGPTQPQVGAAYVFRRSGTNWSLNTRITAPDGAPSDYFGAAVAMSGDGSYAIAGAYEHDDVSPGTGSVYVYDFPMILAVSTPIVADGTLLSFTGQHICFPEGPMEQGLVVSANKNKYVSLNGPLETDVLAIRSSESLPVVSLSNVANDRTAFGVVDHFEQSGTTRTQDSGATITRQHKEIGDNRVIVNSLGEGAIWIANTNGNVASGDLLTTSHLPGYAQKQDDNIFRNRTVAKSTIDCNFGSEKIPARIVLKDEDGNNVLDSYGRLQWVDDPERTVPKYKIRYLDVSGTPTDEANAVHRAAFVGCTYHCG